MRPKTVTLTALLLLVLCSIGEVIGKVDIRQTTANKAFMETMRADGYEIVHPFQIRDKNERIGIDTRNYFLKAQEHYSHVTIVIRSTQLGRLKLVLERNNFVFLNQTAFHKLDADGERVIQNRVENCYYQGTVGGEDTSFVALSSCNGLRGVISFANGTTYGIWPLDGGDRNSRRHPHILYKSEWSQEAKCGSSMAHAVGSQRVRREGQHKHRRHSKGAEPRGAELVSKRDVSKRTKYVEVALIADYEFMKQRGLHDMDAISYMLESLNIADSMLSRDLNIRLSAVYIELWSDVQRIDLWEDIERTLSGVVDYAAGHIYHIQKDATVLFTGGSAPKKGFANSEVSNAAIRSICTARSAVILKAVDPYGTHFMGELMAQSVGHLLGLEHDTTACSCEPAPECLMRQVMSAGAPWTWQFSKCSVARMHGIWQDGNIQCLLNKPFQVSELRECGNGIVDGTEECDCGARESCQDPCCDPLTCTLRPHAQCAAHQSCCHRCELRKSGETCRPSESPCDVAETCDGKSGDCPPDGHLIDGTVCGQDGQCWRGNCSDSHEQCQRLWGREARVAEPVCFEQNVKGAEYANCGGAEGSHQGCQGEDTMCGTLHCHLGSLTPMDSSLKAFTFHFTEAQRQVQCKSIASSASSKSTIGMVSDGTSCGSGKVCVASSCVEMSSVSSPTACPTNNLALLCSGHGHCTTTAQCVCFNGWTGKACDIRSNTSTYSGSMGFDEKDSGAHHFGVSKKTITIPHIGTTTLETATLFAILLGFGVFLLLCLVCLMLCYRRKSIVEIPKPSDEKLEESPDRQIKFGNMPSYREEKRKKRSNKRIYGALNRITEADERDSTSLRSRDSAGSQQLLDRNGQPAGMGIRDPYATEHHIYAESTSSGAPHPHHHLQQQLHRQQYRGTNSDGSYPLRSFGSWRSSGQISPASSSGHLTDVSTSTTPLRLNKIGKLLKTMPVVQNENEVVRRESMTKSPFLEEHYRLQNLQNHAVLSTRLDQHHHPFGHHYPDQEELSTVEADEHDVGSNTESSRGCGEDSGGDSGASGAGCGWDPPSVVNGASGSTTNYTFTQSPSLFNDSFKLEMDGSMHN